MNTNMVSKTNIPGIMQIITEKITSVLDQNMWQFH